MKNNVIALPGRIDPGILEWALGNEDASAAERIVLAAIASRYTPGEGAVLSLSDLSRICGLDKVTVARRLKSLAAKGCIRRVKRMLRGSGRHLKNRLYLACDPVFNEVTHTLEIETRDDTRPAGGER